MSGERPNSRAIIDNVTQRLVNGGVPADRARAIAVETRKRVEASDSGSNPQPIYRTPEQIRRDRENR